MQFDYFIELHMLSKQLVVYTFLVIEHEIPYFLGLWMQQLTLTLNDGLEGS